MGSGHIACGFMAQNLSSNVWGRYVFLYGLGRFDHITSYYTIRYILHVNNVQDKYPNVNFTYGVVTCHFVSIAFVPNPSRDKLMVLNPEGYRKWEHDPATKWRLVCIIRLLKGNHVPPLQNDVWKGLDVSLLLHVKHAIATKRTCCFPKDNFPCYKMTFDFGRSFNYRNIEIL